MSSLKVGNSTSAEVTNISQFGVWILYRGKEYFVSYQDFPWFKSKTVEEISNIETPSDGHFYWPELDVDLSIEILGDPGKYPLQYK